MPLKRAVSEREPQPPLEQEEEEVRAQQPALEPVGIQAIEQEPYGAAPAPERQQRPYQDFVESEARKYWQELRHAGNLTKPAQQEIRAAAMPILCQALRNRPGNRRHVAVASMAQHALEKGLIKRPFSEANESPSYIEALIQLADDANWLAREIPLPDHPEPKHPPVYYTVGSMRGRPHPIPRVDSLIRGDYVYDRMGNRLTKTDYIYPWPDSSEVPTKNDLITRGWDACYTLYMGAHNQVTIMFHWIRRRGGFPLLFSITSRLVHFSKYPQAAQPGRSGE